MKVVVVVLSLILSLSCITLVHSLSCLNHKGEPVDWFFMLKLGSDVSTGGFTYAYFDAQSNGQYVIGSLEKEDNPLAITTQQLGLYQTDRQVGSDVGYLLYNDQTYDHFSDRKVVSHYNDGNGAVYGHAKGFVGFDMDGSFWIGHSAPGFPYNHSMAPSYWFFPYSQTVYGQHFFCTSMETDAMGPVSEQLTYYYPWVYDHRIPDSFAGRFPGLEKLIGGEYSSGFTNTKLKTKGGVPLVGYGKSWDSKSDLYEDVIAPGLNTGLKVMTWCGGTFGYQCDPNYCEGATVVDPSLPQEKDSTYPFDVVMIGNMYFGQGLVFNVTYNHAKFAVAYAKFDVPAPWFCAADINRQHSQRKRGGGALCINDLPFWSTWNTTVIQTYEHECEHTH